LIAVSAGDASGEMHAGLLFRELRKLEPGVQAFGIGSDSMRAEGIEIVFDSSGWGVMGIYEACKLIPRLLAVRRAFKRMLRAGKPDALLLVDFGAFNVRIAAVAREQGIPTMYYFPPGSWRRQPDRQGRRQAWLGDVVVTPFPWSADDLASKGIDARFFGHPILDAVQTVESRGEFCRRHGIGQDARLVALLPGSRKSEVKYILPTMLLAAAEIARRLPEAVFLVSAASDPLLPLVERSLRQVSSSSPWRDLRDRVRISEGRPYGLLNAADLVIATSGSVTLEAAVFGKPMVIVYKGARINEIQYRFIRNRIGYIGLPNIIAEKRICPELIQHEATPERIASEALELLTDRAKASRMRADLAEVRSALGEPGATKKAAQVLRDLATRKATVP
jgi:lipid-A-disaccharide synthase